MIGHRKIWQFFQKTVQSGKLAQAYLFWGPENLGKKFFALNLAQALVCEEKTRDKLSYCGQCQGCQMVSTGTHPDICFLEPAQLEKQNLVKEAEIKIDQVRNLQHRLSLSPYLSPYKIAIIDEADRLTQEAGNALLKTLEEPSGQAMIILISARPQMILSTIISRCQKIRFNLVSQNELKNGLKKLNPKLNQKRLEELVRLSFGRPGIAISFLEDRKMLTLRQKAPNDLKKIKGLAIKERFDYAQELSKDRGLANFVLDSWLIYFRDLLLVSLGRPELTVYQQKFSEKFSEVEPRRIKPRRIKDLRVLIEKISQTRLLLANSSFNARLILENLLMEI